MCGVCRYKGGDDRPTSEWKNGERHGDWQKGAVAPPPRGEKGEKNMELIKREDAIRYCKSKAEHYRKRLARIEAQGDAIGYDPTEQIKGFKDEIAIYESFVKELEDIPSADKQGEWIVHGEPPLYVKECSVCGSKFFHHAMEDLTPYCAMCGAKMEGVDDED